MAFVESVAWALHGPAVPPRALVVNQTQSGSHIAFPEKLLEPGINFYEPSEVNKNYSPTTDAQNSTDAYTFDFLLGLSYKKCDIKQIGIYG